MPTPGYPLIFIVEDNSVFSNLIVSHLRSNKFKRIESYHSGEECMINLFKKPDIVIQDYITNDMTDNSIQKSSKESNLNTEFIFLSDLNNFSNSSNQNKDFIPIAVSDEFAAATDIIKYGPHEFVVKDLSALNKLIAYFSHTHQTRLQTQYDLIGLGLFLATLILLIFGMFQKG